jgi:hypothetical protein
VHSGEAAHGFRRATTSGADGGDDVKESHGWRGNDRRSGGSRWMDCTRRDIARVEAVCGIAS